MRSNGSVYVGVVFAALIAYFTYQWWFNPSRMVKHRLGEVAAALSVPDDETEAARQARLDRLRGFLDDNLHLRAGGDEITSRDRAIAAAAGWKPSRGGGDVHFADVQVFVETEDAAHAYLAVELTSDDHESGHSTIDTRDASVSLARLNGEWVITTAELKGMPGRR